MKDAIYYDRQFIKDLKRETDLLWLLAYRYRSNWRVLHIDGFETGRMLPISSGVSRIFFSYGV